MINTFIVYKVPYRGQHYLPRCVYRTIAIALREQTLEIVLTYRIMCSE